MSKEAWFRHFERLQKRYPSLPDYVLAEAAQDALRDELAEKADWARLLKKENR